MRSEVRWGRDLDESRVDRVGRPDVDQRLRATKTLADRIARQASPRGAVSVVYPRVIYAPGELTEGNIVVRHLLTSPRRLPPSGKPSGAGNTSTSRTSPGASSRLSTRRGRTCWRRERPPGRFLPHLRELPASGLRVAHARRRASCWRADKTLARLRKEDAAAHPELVEVYRQTGPTARSSEASWVTLRH